MSGPSVVLVQCGRHDSSKPEPAQPATRVSTQVANGLCGPGYGPRLLKTYAGWSLDEHPRGGPDVLVASAPVQAPLPGERRRAKTMASSTGLLQGCARGTTTPAVRSPTARSWKRSDDPMKN